MLGRLRETDRMSKRKPRYQAPEGSLRAALDQLPDVRRGQG